MNVGDNILERLPTADAWVADWPDVLERAQYRRARRVGTKRRAILTVAALVAVLIPLAALAAANDWWFIRLSDAPKPTSPPLVVKEGEWDGRAWQLVAFPTTTDGLCVAFTSKASIETDDGGAMNCSTFEGVSRTPETKGSPNLGITYLTGDVGLGPYIVGPVVATATTVEIRFDNGATLRLPTSPGPTPLEHIRFYAAPLPAGVTPNQIKWLAGIDERGSVVACLAPDTSKEGVSPLSDCR